MILLQSVETTKAKECFDEALRQRLLLKESAIPRIGRFEDSIKRAKAAQRIEAGFHNTPSARVLKISEVLDLAGDEPKETKPAHPMCIRN